MWSGRKGEIEGRRWNEIREIREKMGERERRRNIAVSLSGLWRREEQRGRREAAARRGERERKVGESRMNELMSGEPANLSPET